MANTAVIFEDNDISSNSLLISESEVVSPVIKRANSHCLEPNIENFSLKALNDLLGVDVNTLTTYEVIERISKLWDKL
ncbi:MAG: hypothetical protein IJW54_03895 [Clostridia bacterium]|nr:hypothetical protein [Clostridia bacterium]